VQQESERERDRKILKIVSESKMPDKIQKCRRHAYLEYVHCAFKIISEIKILYRTAREVTKQELFALLPKSEMRYKLIVQS
jgi:hypothetical protein